MPLNTVLFLTLINTLNYLDRYILAAVLTSVSADLSLTQAQAGWLMSAFVPGYIIFSPIFGYLGDRFNRPKLMALGVAIWSVATLLSAYAHSFELFLFSRVLVGIGEASFASIAPGLIKDRTQDPIKVNSLLSLFFAAIPVGAALGFVLGGVVSENWGWHRAFILGGVPGLLLAPFLLLLAEKRPALRQDESHDTGLISGYKEITKVNILWYAIGGYVFQAMALNGVASFVSAYGIKIGFSESAIGTYFGIILVVSGFAGTFFGGRMASRLAAKSGKAIPSMLTFVGLTAFLAVPFLASAFFFREHTSFLIFCFIAELLVFAGTSPVNSVIVLASPKLHVALTQGVTILALNLLGALPVSPMVGNLADRYGIESAMRLLWLPLFMAAIIWTLGARKSRLTSP